MEADTALLLQKQVKDNSQDLQKEFLDMKLWEEEMRKKDNEIRKEAAGEKSLPPIRSKTQKEVKKTVINNKEPNKPKRIKTYDYAGWNAFDADKACEEIDKENQCISSNNPRMAKDILQTAHDEAMKYKEDGNVFVKQQKWENALECYTKAIKTYPYNAVFYANRGLCQLKLKHLQSAVTDCTAALQLDTTYVKAYFRRATARMSLHQYKDAKEDLEEVLKLEPSNKEAKFLIADVEKNIEASKPIENSKERTLGKSTMDKRKDAQTCPSPTASMNVEDTKREIRPDSESPTVKQQKRDSSVPKTSVANADVPVEENLKELVQLPSKQPYVKISAEDVALAMKHKVLSNKTVSEKDQQPAETSETLVKDGTNASEPSEKVVPKRKSPRGKGSKKQVTTNDETNALKQKKTHPQIPEWLAENNEISVIESPEKPPHMRSKKPMLVIPVEDVKMSAKSSGSPSNNNKPAEKLKNVTKTKTIESEPSKSDNTGKTVETKQTNEDRWNLEWLADKNEVSIVKSLKKPPNSPLKPLVKIPLQVLEHAIKHSKDNDDGTPSDNKQLEETDANPSKQKKSQDRIPDWLKENNEISIVQSPDKPSDVRQKPKVNAPVIELEVTPKKSAKHSATVISNKDQRTEVSNTAIGKNVPKDIVTAMPPRVPRTAVQFLKDWKTSKSPEFRYKYLKQLSKGSLPKIFKDSMESDTFSEILVTLSTEFIKMQDPVFEYLEDISQVNRFRALIMFIGNTEKEALKTLFKYCLTIKNNSEKEVEALQEKYEVL